MTNDDAVLGDDGLRLLDVLLEEEAIVAAAAHPATLVAPARTWLRAIAALLGVVVVVATSWLAVQGTAPAPADSPQDPTPAPRTVPFDPALLPRVVAVRISGPERVVGEKGSVSKSPPSPSVEFREPAVLQGWRTAIAACTVDKDGKALRMFRIALVLDDGTLVAGTADVRGMLRFGDHARGTNHEVRDLLLMATQEHARQRRRVEQIATSLAELRALPADLRRVASPMLTAAELRDELARFPRLEVLEFVPHVRGRANLADVEPRRVPTADVVAGLASIPNLREVTLHVDLLDADGLRALAALPKLQVLNVVGEAKRLPASELGALAHRLDTLRLLAGEPSAAQLGAIATSPTLRELWLQCGPDFGPVADCLAKLPALQRLSLQGYGTLDADEALAAIARTGVHELRLANLRVDGKALAKLVAMTSLQTLELEDLRIEPEQLTGLAPLPQVQHLATDITSPKFAPLFAAFPNAKTHTGESGDTWVSPFAVRR